MIRVYAVVEGATEESFLNRNVVPHLAARSVFLLPDADRSGAAAQASAGKAERVVALLDRLGRHQPEIRSVRRA